MLGAMGEEAAQHGGVGEHARLLPVDEHRALAAHDQVEGQQVVVAEGPGQGRVQGQEPVVGGPELRLI